MALSALYADEFTLDKDWYTEDEYFALEDRSPERWEFLADGPLNEEGLRLGRIRAMSGGTLDHSGIAANLITSLNNALRGAGVRTCRVFGSDVKIHTPAGRNTFPDVSMVCGKPILHRGRHDIYTNPILVAEVLSPSTMRDDLGKKREIYQAIPTLQHYLILAADHASVELYTREANGWKLETFEGLETLMPLPAISVTLTIADLYVQIEFE